MFRIKHRLEVEDNIFRDILGGINRGGMLVRASSNDYLEDQEEEEEEDSPCKEEESSAENDKDFLLKKV